MRKNNPKFVDSDNVEELMDKVEVYSKELLKLTLRDYCQYYWSNNWIKNLEYDLWSFVCGDADVMWQTGFGSGLTQSDRDRLRTLSIDAGGWYCWPEGEYSEIFVPIQKWCDMYKQRKSLENTKYNPKP